MASPAAAEHPATHHEKSDEEQLILEEKLHGEEYSAKLSKMRVERELREALKFAKGPEKAEIQGKIDLIHKEIEQMRKERSDLSKIKRGSFHALPGHEKPGEKPKEAAKKS